MKLFVRFHGPRRPGTVTPKGLDTGPGRVRPHKRGRVDATPPPPCQEEALYAAGRCQARKSRDRGDITPTSQRFWLR